MKRIRQARRVRNLKHKKMRRARALIRQRIANFTRNMIASFEKMRGAADAIDGFHRGLPPPGTVLFLGVVVSEHQPEEDAKRGLCWVEWTHRAPVIYVEDVVFVKVVDAEKIDKAEDPAMIREHTGDPND